MASANALTSLNELATKLGQKLTEEQVSEEGPPNARTYTYVLTLDGARGTGTGRSKKKAKHNAGTQLLENLEQRRSVLIPKGRDSAAPVGSPKSPPTVPVESPKASPGSISLTCSSLAPSVPINYKGKLQEMMQKHGFPLPVYKLTKIGPPQFSVLCTVYHSNQEVMDEAYGNGSTKKDAEANAARAMIDKVGPYINSESLTPSRARQLIPKALPVSNGPADLVEISELIAQLMGKGCECPEFLFKNSDYKAPNSIPEKLCLASVRAQPMTVQGTCHYDVENLPIVAQGRGETEDVAKMQAVLNLIDNVNILLPTSP